MRGRQIDKTSHAERLEKRLLLFKKRHEEMTKTGLYSPKGKLIRKERERETHIMQKEND